MGKDQVNIKKNSGDLEPFSIEKLKESLTNCGVKNDEIDNIVQIIEPQVYDGISSEEIHKKVFPLLKKYNRVYASKYNLKRAILDLGPTGYPFERLVGALLKEKGFQTKVSVILNGECVTHEIDVLAEKDGNTYAIECKFHSDPNAASNVKVPLYINSRFLDVQQQWNTDSAEQDPFKAGLVGYQYSIYIGRHKLRQMYWADTFGLGLPQEQRYENSISMRIGSVPDYGTYYFDQERKG